MSPKELEPRLEQELWKVRNALTDSVAPATPTSLRAAADPERGNRWLRPRSEQAMAERRARLWMVLTLGLLLVAQVYALVGSSILTDTDRLLVAVGEAEDERATLKLSSDAPKLAALDAVEGRFKELSRRLEAETDLLGDWNSWWRLPWKMSFEGRIPVSPPTGPRAIAKQAAVDQQAARAALDALSTYFLPLLYGVLGATAYILRRLADQIADSTFTGASLIRYRIRLALGAVFGVTATLLIEAAAGADESLQLSGLAAAFVAGYSVEVVMSLFDYWIDRIRKALRPPEGPGELPANPVTVGALLARP